MTCICVWLVTGSEKDHRPVYNVEFTLRVPPAALLPGHEWAWPQLLFGCPSAQVTHDVTDLTFASFLSEVGKKTDLTARFSTVVHERGSPETMRDVRGFSVKVTIQYALLHAVCCNETQCFCTSAHAMHAHR